MILPLYFNKTIKKLIFYDFILLFGWGLVYPIISVFVVNNITGGDVRVAGVAIGIYWITSSLIQIPVGVHLDNRRGEKDDLHFLIVDTLIVGIIPFVFRFAFLPWHVYLFLFFYAVGMGMAMPAWYGIFTRHIDGQKEAQSWAANQALLGVGAGIAGIIGGTIASIYGFEPLFAGVGFMGLLSAFFVLLIRKEIWSK
jgi:MFS family permease